MYYHYQRSYRGPVQAVILDWAGTTVDYGSLAPLAAFIRLFAEREIAINADEARGPMGKEKREHIRQLCEAPAIAERWYNRYGQRPNESDVEQLYQAFLPLQLETIRDYAELIPGCREAIATLRTRGIRIGSNTGYSREMLEPLLLAATGQGYSPDSTVCATEVSRGRPYPDMSFRNLLELQVDTVQACVKVDDTVPGIEEGLNAGLWTIGVALSGNEIGMSLSNWQALPRLEQNRRRTRAHHRLLNSGAHYVIDTITDLPRCLDAIETRLARGERP